MKNYVANSSKRSKNDQKRIETNKLHSNLQEGEAKAVEILLLLARLMLWVQPPRLVANRVMLISTRKPAAKAIVTSAQASLVVRAPEGASLG